ncbi:MAG: ABC-2 transporter permease [Clostridia bacterium]|nr:ABC-2 transporter permease [Clostridia bacterium]
MSGMLLKDWYLMKSAGKSTLSVIAVFVILVLTGVYDITFFNVMFVMLLTMMPVTAFAYDEQAGWDKYAAATPAGRVGVVRGKYIFSLLLWLVSLVLTLGFTVIAHVLHPEKSVLAESVISGAVVVSVGLVMVDILLPLIFKFGSQKSRVMLILVVGVLVGVGVGASVMMERGGIGMPVQLAGMLLPVVALGGFLISYFTSLSIYQKKEL